MTGRKDAGPRKRLRRRLAGRLSCRLAGSARWTDSSALRLLAGTLVVLVGAVATFTALLYALTRIDDKDIAIEQGLESALLDLARTASHDGAGTGFVLSLDEATDTLSRFGDFGGDGIEFAAGGIIGSWGVFRPHLVDSDGNLDDRAIRSAIAGHEKLAQGLSSSIESFLPLLREHRQSLRSSFAFLLFMSALGFCFVAVYVVTLWARLREARLETDWSRRGLQRSLEAEEAERRRIARDIHDDAAQDVAAARMLCDRAKAAADGDTARKRAGEAADLLGAAGSKLRSLAMDLRPAALEQGGLVLALDSLCERHARLLGASIQLAVSEESSAIAAAADEGVSIHVYRIVQEALANASKHAPGHRIEVRVERAEEAGRPGLAFVVRDSGEPEGQGEPPGDGAGAGEAGDHPALRVDGGDFSMSSGTGLGIMAERAAFLGGNLDVDFLGDSTTLRLFVPVDTLRTGGSCR